MLQKLLQTLKRILTNVSNTSNCKGVCQQGRIPCHCLEEARKNSNYDYNGLDGRNH